MKRSKISIKSLLTVFITAALIFVCNFSDSYAALRWNASDFDTKEGESSDAGYDINRDGDTSGREHGGCGNGFVSNTEESSDPNKRFEHFECWVDPVANSTWDSPKIRVTYETHLIFGSVTDSSIMTWDISGDNPENCKWFYHYVPAVRVCVRPTPAGTTGDASKFTESAKNPSNNYGNRTGDTKKPRTQLCAYEDPMDLGDTNASFSPFHNDTPKIDIVTASNSALYMPFFDAKGDLAAGEVALDIVLVPVSFAITAVSYTLGALVDLFIDDANDWVHRDLGCVDLPIADGPPIFSHEAWFVPYWPTAEVRIGAPSTFEKPVIQIFICKDEAGKLASCKKQSDGKLKKDITLAETISLEPNSSNGFKSKKNAKDGRIFEARITKEDPSRICVYNLFEPASKKSQSASKTVNKLQGCVARSGYMPKPVVSSPADSEPERPKITVRMADKSITLWEDPRMYDPTSTFYGNNRCDSMHQIKFCAYRPCLDNPPSGPRHPDCKKKGDAACKAVCLQPDSQVCVSGYDRAPIVVSDRKTNAPISISLTPPGNTRLTKGDEFKNTAAVPEVSGDSIYTYPEMSFPRNVVMYNPPRCYQRSKDGKCANYDGVCCTNDTCSDVAKPYQRDGQCIQYVRNVTTDRYYVDTRKYLMRPISPEEAGLCVTDLDESVIWVRSKPGRYNYKVPAGCNKITIELWGSGAGGVNMEKSTPEYAGSDIYLGSPYTQNIRALNDAINGAYQTLLLGGAGGAGGYIKAYKEVNFGEIYSVIIGRGGNRYKDGEDSSFSKYTESEKIVIARGGNRAKDITKELVVPYYSDIFGAPKKEGEYTVEIKGFEEGGAGGSSTCNGEVECDDDEKKDGRAGQVIRPGTPTAGGEAWQAKFCSKDNDCTTEGYVISNLKAKQCDSSTFYDYNLYKSAMLPDINVISNYKYPYTAGVGGCAVDDRFSGITQGIAYHRQVGVGGHGKARISCVADE